MAIDSQGFMHFDLLASEKDVEERDLRNRLGADLVSMGMELIRVGDQVRHKRYGIVGRVTGIGSVNNPLGRHYYVDYGVGNKTCLEPQRDLERV